MTETDEAQDFKRRARRRLIGAIALVLFLVIVPPWIMEREPKPTVSGLSVEIPSQDVKKAAPKPAAQPARPEEKPARPPEKASALDAPAGEDARSAVADANSVEGKSSTAPSRPESAEKTDKTEHTDKAPGPASPTSTPAKPPPAKELARRSEAERAESLLAGAPQVTYIVPVGTYANGNGVKQLQAKISNLGVKSYTEPVSGGTQTRLRAGPFTSRESAERAREKLAGLGLKPGAVIARK